MGLPKGELPRCIDKERGSAYGQMLWEEVQEVRDAVEGGILHGVLAESIDVLYLVFNLLQECGLERAIEPAFLLKHGDNMKKQHETVTHWRALERSMSRQRESLKKSWHSPSPERKAASGFCTPRENSSSPMTMSPVTSSLSSG